WVLGFSINRGLLRSQAFVTCPKPQENSICNIQLDVGYDPESHNKFVSFKELVFFFQDVGKMQH
ncbi:hypothetical protein, partial [Dyadobacter sp.]|uniref:hypothetical protein n=1 Tax=Dyadobacter sp. TaxID=1914288 RepID=UPI003F6FD99F